jgi:hypothetical protein
MAFPASTTIFQEMNYAFRQKMVAVMIQCIS